MPNEPSAKPRRAPQQERSRLLVEAVLEAVPRVVQRFGASAVTTNRIAEVAGVSIGSLYQYFPDKLAIYGALHDRHVEEVRRCIEQAQGAGSSVRDFAGALMEGLADVHASAAEVHQLLSTSVPDAAEGFQQALQGVFEQVLETAEPKAGSEPLRFVLPRLVEALAHGVPQQRAPRSAKGDAVRAVLVYVDACEGGAVS